MFESTLARLQDGKRRRTEDRTQIGDICREFYTNLFASKMEVKTPQITKGNTEHLPVLISEVRTAAFQMSDGKAPGPDNINIEVVKAGGHELWKAFAVRFSRYLKDMRIPSSWKESKTAVQEGRQRKSKELSPNMSALSHLQAVLKNTSQ